MGCRCLGCNPPLTFTFRESLYDGSATLADVKRNARLGSRRLEMVPPSNHQVTKGTQRALNIQDAMRNLDSAQVLSTLEEHREHPSSSNLSIRSGSAPSRAGPSKRPRPARSNDQSDDFEANEGFGDRFGPTRSNTGTPEEASPERRRVVGQPRARPLELMPERRIISQSNSPEEGYDFQELDRITLSQRVQDNKRDYNRHGREKTLQVRYAWSARDSNQLIKLMAKHCCSWAAIAKEGGFEVQRNQQAVRDHARILKVQFLKGDSLLPAFFDNVALGEKERQAIINIGRNPDRKEHDVDENGNITNQYYHTRRI